MSEADDKFVVEEVPEGAVPPSQDDELKSYSEGVQKRINDEVAKTRRLERELADAQAFGKKAADVAKRAAMEVQALRQRTETSEDAMIKGLVSSIESDLGLAKSEMKAALESQDPEKITEATAKVSGLAADLRRAQVAKTAHEADLIAFREKAEADRQAAAARPPVTQPQAKPVLAARAQEWLAKNAEWFNKDQEKTRTAAAASDFVAKSMGFGPDDERHYIEVDKMIAARHGAPTNAAPTRDQGQQTQAVNPQGRSAPAAPGARKVTLTPSEAGTARRLGISLEDYAKAKSSGSVVL